MKAPGFSSDDFYIFYLISKDPLRPVSLNPQEIFFLFLRPVSYFSFWITNHILSGSPVLMKFFSLLLHLAAAAVIYRLVVSAGELAGRKDDRVLAGLVVLLFTVHPDVMMYILHINNRTELLMILFYSTALLVTSGYLTKRTGGRQLPLELLPLFILSVMSKQNGLHLPLLLLFPLCLMDLDPVKKRTLTVTFLLMLVPFAGFSLLNYYYGGFYGGEAGDWLWRKPLSAAGTLLFTVFPFIAGEIYSKALQLSHIPGIAAAAVFLASPISWRKIGAGLTLPALCLFYPRIFALGGGRINTHLLLWFVIALYIFLPKLKAVYRYGLPVILISIYAVFSFSMVSKIEENNSFRKQQSFELKEIIESKGKPFVALSGMAASLYEYNYHTTGKFGDPGIEGNVLVYKYLFPEMERKEKVITYKQEGEHLVFSSLSEKVFIGEHPANRITNKYITEARGEVKREYHSFSIRIPDSIKLVAFHNGCTWEVVEL